MSVNVCKNMAEEAYVTKVNQCYHSAVETPNDVVEIPDLKSNHREAGPSTSLYILFASSTGKSSAVCIVADDTDVYSLLLYMSQYCSGMKKCTFNKIHSSNEGIAYYDVNSLANHLGEVVCEIMPAFHTLTRCDYTAPFFGRSKYSIFKNMQKHSNNKTLLLSLNTERV